MKPGLLRELLGEALREQRFAQCRTPVSYTHLTLPTKA